jgi:hypothetical protein
VEVAYAPVLPCLKVPDRKAVLFAPYKMPAGVERRDGSVRKVLGMRRRKSSLLLGKGFTQPLRVEDLSPPLEEPGAEDEVESAEPPAAPAAAVEPTWQPLVLWRPPEGEEGAGQAAVEVDGVVCRFLREHQREGVQFMVSDGGCEEGARWEEGECGRVSHPSH